jgi:DnaJ-class molecular chaperone
VGFFECQACLGRGTVDDEYPITVTFPAGLVDGCTERVSLSSAGLIGVNLVLHFRAAEQL